MLYRRYAESLTLSRRNIVFFIILFYHVYIAFFTKKKKKNSLCLRVFFYLGIAFRKLLLIHKS